MKFKLKNTKKDRIVQISILCISLIVAGIVLVLLFSKKGDNLNEGNFKLNDVIISNTIDITDMLLGKEILDTKTEYNLSINSKIDISIAKLSNINEIKSAYIDNFNTNLSYEYNVYRDIKELELINSNTKFNIDLINKENTHETTFYIACLDIQKNLKLKENINSSSLINALDVGIYEGIDSIGKVKFDLNIIDSKDGKYKATINYDIKLDKFVDENYYIDNINVYNINFRKVN